MLCILFSLNLFKTSLLWRFLWINIFVAFWIITAAEVLIVSELKDCAKAHFYDFDDTSARGGFILFTIVFVMMTDKRVQLKCDFTVNLFLRAIMPWLRKFLPHPNIARSFGSVYVLRNTNGLRASLGTPFLHVRTQFKLGKYKKSVLLVWQKILLRDET